MTSRCMFHRSILTLRRQYNEEKNHETVADRVSGGTTLCRSPTKSRRALPRQERANRLRAIPRHFHYEFGRERCAAAHLAGDRQFCKFRVLVAGRQADRFHPASLFRFCWPTLANERRRSEEHTSEFQSPDHLVCRLLLEKKNKILDSETLHHYRVQLSKHSDDSA